MTQKIYKHPLSDGTGIQLLHIAGLQKILSVKKQNGTAVLYAIVDTDNSVTKDVWIKSLWTGEEIYDDMDKFEYLDSIMFFDGNYVVHYFVKVD